MFQFLKADGTPQGGDGPQTFVPLVEWSLPVVLGGTRRWAVGGRDVVFDGETYTAGAGVVDWSAQVFEAQLNNAEEFELVLSDSDKAWRTLLTDHHIGTELVIRMVREHDGATSSNAMTVCRGWLKTATSEHEDGGSLTMRLTAGNELWNQNRDSSLLMTHENELGVDEDATSLRYAAEVQSISWGTTAGQGVRQR